MLATAASVRTLDLGSDSDRDRHDAYVRAHPDSSAFHLTAWGRAVAKGTGQSPHYLVAEHAGAVVGVLPLTHVRSPLFGQSLVSNAFAVYGGPLADSDAAHAALDEAAWKLAQSLGLTSLEYRNQQRLRPDWPAKTGSYVTFRRALAADSEANLKAIPRKQRAEVRRSLEFGLDVRVASDERARAEHFAVYAESVRNLGTPVFPRALFDAILDEYGADADILTVSKDGTPIASVLSLYYRGEVLPYYGGGTPAARALRGNDHMYWMLMEHARERGCTSFDFGRSKVGTGAFSFKKNWGFEPTPLAYEFRLAPGAAMPDVNPLNPKYRLMVETWSRLPLWLANRLGPLLSRGLG
ncbi:FemAB family XrtA/PEP-CTERM system-associated protein [Sphingoaurantiacus capsulatus]|uniref:FemAB family XrtA/PEP-CTERM system-associated protein n=1 Tax=Sphingoaurantiacus capsulatus TaxID=1771310 RepID=A0ABV7XD54_9SPHN